MATANEIEIRVTVDDRTKAPFRKIEQQLRSQSGGFGKIGREAGGAFSSGFGGALGGIQSAVTSLGGSFLKLSGPIMSSVGALAGIGAVAGPALIGIGTAAVAAGGALMTGLVAAVGALGAIAAQEIPAVKTAFTDLGKTVKTGLVDVIKNSGFDQMLLGMVAQLKQAFTDLKPALTDMFEAVQVPLRTLVSGFVQLANNLVPRLATAFQSMGPVMEGVATLLADIGTGLGDMFIAMTQHAEGFQATFVGLGAVFRQVLPAIGEFVGVLADVMGPVLQQLAPVLAEFVRQLGPMLATAIQQVAPLMPALFEGFTQLLAAIIPILPQLTQLAVAILPPLASAIQFVGTLIQSVLVPAFQVIAPVVQGVIAVFQGFFSFVQAGFQIMTGNVQGALNTIASVFGTTWENIRATVTGAMEAIKAGVATGIQNVQSTISSGLQAAVNLVRGMVGAFTSAGSAIISGLWEGAKSMMNRVISWVQQQLAYLRSLFPFSPAKRGPFAGKGYTKHSGIALMKDFGEGIKKGQAKVVLAAQGALSAAQGALGFSVQGRRGKLASGAISGLPRRSAYSGQGAPSASMLGDHYRRQTQQMRAGLRNVSASQITVAGDADGAVAALIAKLIRTGKLKIA